MFNQACHFNHTQLHILKLLSMFVFYFLIGCSSPQPVTPTSTPIISSIIIHVLDKEHRPISNATVSIRFPTSIPTQNLRTENNGQVIVYPPQNNLIVTIQAKATGYSTYIEIDTLEWGESLNIYLVEDNEASFTDAHERGDVTPSPSPQVTKTPEFSSSFVLFEDTFDNNQNSHNWSLSNQPDDADAPLVWQMIDEKLQLDVLFNSPVNRTSQIPIVNEIPPAFTMQFDTMIDLQNNSLSTANAVVVSLKSADDVVYLQFNSNGIVTYQQYLENESRWTGPIPVFKGSEILALQNLFEDMQRIKIGFYGNYLTVLVNDQSYRTGLLPIKKVETIGIGAYHHHDPNQPSSELSVLFDNFLIEEVVQTIPQYQIQDDFSDTRHPFADNFADGIDNWWMWNNDAWLLTPDLGITPDYTRGTSCGELIGGSSSGEELFLDFEILFSGNEETKESYLSIEFTTSQPTREVFVYRLDFTRLNDIDLRVGIHRISILKEPPSNNTSNLVQPVILQLPNLDTDAQPIQVRASNNHFQIDIGDYKDIFPEYFLPINYPIATGPVKILGCQDRPFTLYDFLINH